eukprot:gene7520-5302_t
MIKKNYQNPDTIKRTKKNTVQTNDNKLEEEMEVASVVGEKEVAQLFPAAGGKPQQSSTAGEAAAGTADSTPRDTVAPPAAAPLPPLDEGEDAIEPAPKKSSRMEGSTPPSSATEKPPPPETVQEGSGEGVQEEQAQHAVEEKKEIVQIEEPVAQEEDGVGEAAGDLTTAALMAPLEGEEEDETIPAAAAEVVESMYEGEPSHSQEAAAAAPVREGSPADRTQERRSPSAQVEVGPERRPVPPHETEGDGPAIVHNEERGEQRSRPQSSSSRDIATTPNHHHHQEKNPNAAALPAPEGEQEGATRKEPSTAAAVAPAPQDERSATTVLPHLVLEACVPPSSAAGEAMEEQQSTTRTCHEENEAISTTRTTTTTVVTTRTTTTVRERQRRRLEVEEELSRMAEQLLETLLPLEDAAACQRAVARCQAILSASGRRGDECSGEEEEEEADGASAFPSEASEVFSRALEAVEQRHRAQRERATAGLLQCSRDIIKPDAEEVAAHVRLGGDVLAQAEDMPRPVLHQFIRFGHVKCVAACLRTTRGIDFTRTDEYGWSPLHLLSTWKRSSVAGELLRLLLDRLSLTAEDPGEKGLPQEEGAAGIPDAAEEERRAAYFLHPPRGAPVVLPRDVVNWNARDNVGNDLLSVAARWGHLHVVWPMLRERVSYFQQRLRAMELERTVLHRTPRRWQILCRVGKADWEKLSAQDKKCFDLIGGFKRDDEEEEDRRAEVVAKRTYLILFVVSKQYKNQRMPGDTDFFFIIIIILFPLRTIFIIIYIFPMYRRSLLERKRERPPMPGIRGGYRFHPPDRHFHVQIIHTTATLINPRMENSSNNPPLTFCPAPLPIAAAEAMGLSPPWK